MENRNGEVHIDETEASGGSKEGVVRYVLMISLALIVIAFTIIVLTGALSQGPVESQQNVQRRVQAQEEVQREQAGSDSSSIDGVNLEVRDELSDTENIEAGQ